MWTKGRKGNRISGMCTCSVNGIRHHSFYGGRYPVQSACPQRETGLWRDNAKAVLEKLHWSLLLTGWTIARDKSSIDVLCMGAHVLGHTPNLLPCPNSYSFYMPIVPAPGWPVTEDGKFSLQQVRSLQWLGHFCLIVLALWWLYRVIWRPPYVVTTPIDTSKCLCSRLLFFWSSHSPPSRLPDKLAKTFAIAYAFRWALSL